MSSFNDGDSRGALLPPDRAFVLQFRQAAGERPESFFGRIEHVTSGASSRFASVDEVVGFIARVLLEQGDQPPRKER